MSRIYPYPYHRMVNLIIANGCPNCGQPVEKVAGATVACERCRIYWELPLPEGGEEA